MVSGIIVRKYEYFISPNETTTKSLEKGEKVPYRTRKTGRVFGRSINILAIFKRGALILVGNNSLPRFPIMYDVVSPSMTPKAVIRPRITGLSPAAAKLINIKWYGTPVKVERPPIVASRNMTV